MLFEWNKHIRKWLLFNMDYRLVEWSALIASKLPWQNSWSQYKTLSADDKRYFLTAVKESGGYNNLNNLWFYYDGPLFIQIKKPCSCSTPSFLAKLRWSTLASKILTTGLFPIGLPEAEDLRKQPTLDSGGNVWDS